MVKKKVTTPSIPKGSSQQEQLNALIETAEVREGFRGDPLDGFVTYRDLVDKGIVNLKNKKIKNPSEDTESPPPPTDPDITPPTPTGFEVSGAFENIILEWDDPRDNFIYYSHTEIWRNVNNNLGNAKLVGQVDGSVYSDNVNTGDVFYYWIRHVNTKGTAGQFNSSDGTLGGSTVVGGEDLSNLSVTAEKIAEAAVIPEKVSKWLSGNSGTSFPDNPSDGELFYRSDLNEVYRYSESNNDWIAVDAVKDGERIAAATIGEAHVMDAAIVEAKIADAAIGSAAIQNAAIKNAAIKDLAVDTGKIADLAVTDAKINDLSATKITTGSIKSLGWSTHYGVKFDLEANNGNGALWMGGYSDPAFYWNGQRVKLKNVNTNSELTLSDQEIIMGNVVNGDYTHLTPGDITFYYYYNAAHHEYKSLKRTEVGQVNSGDTNTLPGYWKNQPSIIISPRNLQVFNGNYSTQTQTLDCRAENIRRTYQEGKWEFDAIAELVLSSGSNTTTITESVSGNTTTNITSTFQTEDNTVSINFTGSWYAESINDNWNWTTLKGTVYANVDGTWHAIYSFNESGQQDYGGKYEGGCINANSGGFDVSLNVPSGVHNIYLSMDCTLESDEDCSADPYCELTWDYMNTDQEGSTVLAQGTLNYIAVGE